MSSQSLSFAEWRRIVLKESAVISMTVNSNRIRFRILAE